MAKNPRNQRKTPKSGEPKRAAVYVDELLPVEERQQELVNILRNVVKNPNTTTASSSTAVQQPTSTNTSRTPSPC